MADELNTEPEFEIGGIVGETKQPKMDDFASTYKEMSDHGFSDEKKPMF